MRDFIQRPRALWSSEFAHPAGGAGFGFEFKFTETPATTKSMRVAMADLRLQRLFVVYPGTRRFELDDNLIALPLTALAEETTHL